MRMKLIRPLVDKVFGRENGLALAFYALWTVVATYPLIRAPADHIENWGDPLLNVWIMAWDLHQLARDPLHLFNAPIFYPAQNTLALSEVLIAQAMEALPIVLVTHNFILAYNLIVLLSFVFCGLGAYWLAREVFPPLPSLLAGAVYAFSFYRVGEYSHIQILSAQWIPFAILALLHHWRRPGWQTSLALAVTVSLQMLSSFYLGLFLVITLAFVQVWLALAEPRPPLRSFVAWGAVAVALVIAVVLPFSLPYFKVEQQFHLQRTLDDAIGGAATFRSYFAVPPTSLLYHSPRWPLLQHMVTDETLFGGIVPLALAIVGLLAGRGRGLVFFLGIGIFGLVLSLGPRLHWGAAVTPIPLPYLLLYRYVPGFHSIRVVGRLGVIETLGLAGVAAAGSAAILKRVPKRVVRPLGLALVLLACGETLAIPTRMTPVETPAEVPPVYRWLAARPDDEPALELPTITSRWLDKASELQRQGHEQYLSIYHWHPTPSGYSGFDPPAFWSLLLNAREFPTDQSTDYLQCVGVKYLIFHADQFPPGRWGQIQASLNADEATFQPLAHFGNDYVYSLATPPDGAAPAPRILLPSMAIAGGTYTAFLEWVNPGQPITIARPAALTITADGWGQPQGARANSPSCLTAGGTTVPFLLTAPAQPGSYPLSVSLNGVTARQTIQVVAEDPGTKNDSPALQLQSATLPTTPLAPGNAVIVNATWRLRHPTGDNYLLGTEVVNAAGAVVAMGTLDPFTSEFPTSRWLTGETVTLTQTAILPRTLPPGPYQIRVLVRYADGVVWKLADPAGKDADQFTVGTISVK